MEPEDLFTLSRGIDWILNHARDLIEESQAMGVSPTPGWPRWRPARGGDPADRRCDRPARVRRRRQHHGRRRGDQDCPASRALYYAETAKLLEVEDMRERISLRELYRRCDLLSHIVVDVAERVVYAVVKES